MNNIIISIIVVVFGLSIIIKNRYIGIAIIMLGISIFFHNSNSKNNKLTFKNNELFITNNDVEHFITGKFDNLDDSKLITGCNESKQWQINFDEKITNDLKNVCPMYTDCKKIGSTVSCKDAKISNNQKILDCSKKYEFLNFMQVQWKDFCKKNPNKCKCIDLNDIKQKKSMIENIKKWVDSLNDIQLAAWKEYLIDNLKIRFVKRKYINKNTHKHENLNDLIEHLKIFDEEIYRIVKQNIGINKQAIMNVIDKLVKTRDDLLLKKTDMSQDKYIRLNLTLQLLDAIVENYEQLKFDNNKKFIPENKCQEIQANPSVGLIKNDLNSLTKINGSCPENFYMKGFRYEKDWSSPKEMKQVLTCCPIKNTETCVSTPGKISKNINKYDITDMSQLGGSCPKYHYIKGINYKLTPSDFNNDDIISIITSNRKYLYFEPVVTKPHYERVCKKIPGGVQSMTYPIHPIEIKNPDGTITKTSQVHAHPATLPVDIEDCSQHLIGEFSTPESGSVTGKNDSFEREYVNDVIKEYIRDPLANEILYVVKQNDEYGFRTKDNFYLSADPSTYDSRVKLTKTVSISCVDRYLTSVNNNLTCNTTDLSLNQQFTIVTKDFSYVAIKNNNNMFLGFDLSNPLKTTHRNIEFSYYKCKFNSNYIKNENSFIIDSDRNQGYVNIFQPTDNNKKIFMTRLPSGEIVFTESFEVRCNDKSNWSLNTWRSLDCNYFATDTQYYACKRRDLDTMFNQDGTFAKKNAWSGWGSAKGGAFSNGSDVNASTECCACGGGIDNMSQSFKIAELDLEKKKNIITATSATLGPQQRFSLEKQGDGTFAIKSGGKYLTFDPSNNVITYQASEIGTNEKFIIKKKLELQQNNICCRAIRGDEKCTTINGEWTKGLIKNNLYSLDKLQATCPENTYLKELNYETNNDKTELRQVLKCCNTDLKDNENVTWDQLKANPNMEIQKNTEIPLEEQVNSLLDKKLKNKFCHSHHFISSDPDDKLHSNVKPDNTCKLDSQYLPDLSKDQEKDENDLEILIMNQNKCSFDDKTGCWLNDNTFLTNGQKILFYLVLLRVKNIKYDLDYNNLVKMFNKPIEFDRSYDTNLLDPDSVATKKTLN